MTSAVTETPEPMTQRGTPVWEVARLFPNQGDWTEAGYLDLANNTREMVEFTDGLVEFLHLPTEINGRPAPRAQRGEPLWEIAWLYPLQGSWSEGDYLALETNHLIELTNGMLEFLPMPPPLHQWIARIISRALEDFVKPRKLGIVLDAPLSVRLGPDKLREPDVVFLRPSRLPDLRQAPNGADLVVEIVSEGSANRVRDLIDKRAEYAQAQIPEYLIVDPEQEQVTVLFLNGNAYAEHGAFQRRETATSRHLEGFSIAVDEVFGPLSIGENLHSSDDSPQAP